MNDGFFYTIADVPEFRNQQICMCSVVSVGWLPVEPVTHGWGGGGDLTVTSVMVQYTLLAEKVVCHWKKYVNNILMLHVSIHYHNCILIGNSYIKINVPNFFFI